MAAQFDLSEVSFVKRIVIGSSNPTDVQSEEKIAEQMNLLNRCLGEQPRGKLIGVEKSFAILQVGEHNVVLQWTTYHVGFKRRPVWLEG